MAHPTTPVEEATQVLQRAAAFRKIGFDDLDAYRLATSHVAYAEVVALIRKGCPLHLVPQILT